MNTVTETLSRAAIEATALRIAPHVRRTPVLQVDGADFGLPGVQLVFKLEYLQHAGSFKARGAFNHLLTRDVPRVGVAAASGGNHGAAVAYAAGQLKVPATIFVPKVASPTKIEQIRAYGATLKIVGERYADALAASEAFVQASGALPIHAYDQIETLQGQATVGLEFERDAPGLDLLLVSVGGGGLIGGIAAWTQGRTRVIGVEPELAPTLDACTAGGRAGRRAGRRHRRRFAGAAAHRHARVSRSPSSMWSAPCWSATTPSATRSARCGACCAWWSSPAAPRRWPRCSAAPCCPSAARRWVCCCAAPTPPRCRSI